MLCFGRLGVGQTESKGKSCNSSSSLFATRCLAFIVFLLLVVGTFGLGG